jgi:hypothetical protein
MGTYSGGMRLVALVTLTAMLSACAAEISYGARPLRTPPTTQAEQCLQDRQLEVATGTAEVNWSEGAGANMTRDVTETQQGLVFYHHGRRLSPTSALRVLGDRELSSAYGRKLDGLAGRYHRSRNSFFFGIFGMLAAPAAMIGYTKIDPTPFDEEPSTTHNYVMLGLAAFWLFTIPFLLFGTFTYRKRRQKYEAYREILFESSILDRLQFRINEFNTAAAADCGL